MIISDFTPCFCGNHLNLREKYLSHAEIRLVPSIGGVSPTEKFIAMNKILDWLVSDQPVDWNNRLA